MVGLAVFWCVIIVEVFSRIGGQVGFVQILAYILSIRYNSTEIYEGLVKQCIK